MALLLKRRPVFENESLATATYDPASYQWVLRKGGIAAMVTDTQQTMTAAQTGTGVMTRAAEQLRQFICGLRGHDALLHFEQGRMSLQCTSCGHETPGWDLRSDHQPKPQPATAKQSPRVVRMPLVRERRVA